MRNTQGAENRLNFNKSALTDHATTESHPTDLEEAKFIDKEPNK